MPCCFTIRLKIIYQLACFALARISYLPRHLFIMCKSRTGISSQPQYRHCTLGSCSTYSPSSSVFVVTAEELCCLRNYKIQTECESRLMEFQQTLRDYICSCKWGKETFEYNTRKSVHLVFFVLQTAAKLFQTVRDWNWVHCCGVFNRKCNQHEGFLG